jgi:hypothetical protein
VSRSQHGHKHVGRRKCSTCRYLGVKEAARKRDAERTAELLSEGRDYHSSSARDAVYPFSCCAERGH